MSKINHILLPWLSNKQSICINCITNILQTRALSLTIFRIVSVDGFGGQIDLSIDSHRLLAFFAVQREIPTSTGVAFSALVYESKGAVPRHPKHRVISLLFEVTCLSRRETNVFLPVTFH